MAIDDAFDKQMMRETGERLLLLRRMHGYADHEIAEALDISDKRWLGWISGEVWLPMHFAAQVAERYGCSIDWLFLGDEMRCSPAFIAKLRHAERSA